MVIFAPLPPPSPPAHSGIVKRRKELQDGSGIEFEIDIETLEFTVTCACSSGDLDTASRAALQGAYDEFCRDVATAVGAKLVLDTPSLLTNGTTTHTYVATPRIRGVDFG